MAKKKMDLDAAMDATVNKTPSVDAIFEAPATAAKEAPAQSSTGAKRGRKPAETTTSDEANVTFKLPKALVRRMKQFIIDYEAEGYGKLTQKDIVIKGVVYALDCPEILDIEVNI